MPIAKSVVVAIFIANAAWNHRHEYHLSMNA